MSKYGLKISKLQKNVLTAEPKDLAFSSDFDTFKIAKTGTFTMVAPSFTATIASPSRTDSSSIAHSLTYKPVYLPRFYTADLGIVYDSYDWTLDQTVVVNDIDEFLVPRGTFGIVGLIVNLDMWVDDNNLYMELYREATMFLPFPPFDTLTFGQLTLTAYYTIFHNQIDITFDLI